MKMKCITSSMTIHIFLVAYLYGERMIKSALNDHHKKEEYMEMLSMW